MGEPTDSLEARWQTWAPGVPLIVVPSPQRSVVRAFLAYLATPEVAAHETIMVLIGEVEPRKLRHHLLLNWRGASSPPRSAGAPTLSSPPSRFRLE